MNFELRDTSIQPLKVIDTFGFEDTRGSFTRLFCANELHNVIGDRKIVQINHSITNEIGALRGMHFQYPPGAELKLIRCIRGRVWDVAVDLRKNSNTFLKWHAEELDYENKSMMLIPEGFAHGFQVLEGPAEMLYLHTNYYDPRLESGIHFADPRVNINWPLKITEISVRDASRPNIDDNFQGINL